ncbi:hypothetical protein VTO42DRAFT_4666 [Malbranchea cinnamomea]
MCIYPPLYVSFLLSLLLSVASASYLTITIPASNILPNPNALPASSHATLTTLSSGSRSQSQSQSAPGLLKARLTRSSTFVFSDLVPSTSATSTTPKSYLLDIHSRDYAFAPYRVDVAANGSVIGVWETFRGNAWENKGAKKSVRASTTYGGATGSDDKGEGVVVEARVLGKKNFYEERPKFNPLSLLKNPMILLGIFALAVTFGMPYLIENMDPELREEFERQRSRGVLPRPGGGRAAPAPGANFDLAGWMAGTTSNTMGGGSESRGATTARESGQGIARRR